MKDWDSCIFFIILIEINFKQRIKLIIVIMNKMNTALILLKKGLRSKKCTGATHAYLFSQAGPRKIIDQSKNSIKLMMEKIGLMIKLQKIQQSKQAPSKDLLKLITSKSKAIPFGDAMKIFHEGEANIYWKESVVTVFLQNVEIVLLDKKSSYKNLKLDSNNNLEYFFQNIKYLENVIKKPFLEAILCFLSTYSENYSEITDQDYYKIKNFLLNYGCYSKHLLSQLQIFPFNKAYWMQKLETLTDQESFKRQFETLSSILQCTLKIGKLEESGKIKSSSKLVTEEIRNTLIEVFFQYINFRPQNIQLLISLDNPQNLFIRDIFESHKLKYFEIIKEIFNPISLFYLKKNENIPTLIFDLLYLYSSAADKDFVHNLLQSYTQFIISSQNDSNTYYKYSLSLILLCQKFEYKSVKFLQQFLANEVFSNSNIRLKNPYWLSRKNFLRNKYSNILKPIQILEVLKLVPKENEVLRKEIENSLILNLQFTRVKVDEQSYNDEETQSINVQLQNFYKYREKKLAEGEITFLPLGVQNAVNQISFGKSYFVYLRSLLELVLSLYGAKWTRGTEVLEKLIQQDNLKIIEEYISFPGLAETAFYLYYRIKYDEEQKLRVQHLEAFVKKVLPSLNKAFINQINNYQANNLVMKVVPFEVSKFEFLSYPEKITGEHFHKKSIQSLFNSNWIMQNYARNNLFREKVSQELEKIASEETALENIVAIPLVFEFPFVCDYSIIINHKTKFALFFISKQESKGKSVITLLKNKRKEKNRRQSQSQKDKLKVRTLDQIKMDLTIKYFHEHNYNIIFLTEDNVTQLKNYILDNGTN